METGAEKFCKYCGAKIAFDAVICTACGRQVEMLKGEEERPNIVINNTKPCCSAPVPHGLPRAACLP